MAFKARREGMRRAELAVLMGLWIKAFLWIAVVLLPGGILLVPVLVGFHERERRKRLRRPPA